MILRLAWAAWSMKPCFKTQKRFKNLFCIGGVLIIHFLKKFLLAFFFFIHLFICAYIVWAISPPYHSLRNSISSFTVTLSGMQTHAWILF
jgi:hypothetical protein